MKKKPKIEDYDFVNLFKEVGIEKYDDIGYLQKTFNDLQEQVNKMLQEKGEKAKLSPEDDYVITKLSKPENEYGSDYYLYAIIRLKKWIKNNSELEQSLEGKDETEKDKDEKIDLLFKEFAPNNDLMTLFREQEEEIKNNEILKRVEEYDEGVFLQETGIEKDSDIGYLKETFEELKNQVLRIVQRKKEKGEIVELSSDDRYVVEKLSKSENECESTYYLYAIMRLKKWINNDLQLDKTEQSLLMSARMRPENKANLKFKNFDEIEMSLNDEQKEKRLNESAKRTQEYIDSIQNNFSMQVKKYIDDEGKDWRNFPINTDICRNFMKWTAKGYPEPMKLDEYTQEDGTEVEVCDFGVLQYQIFPKKEQSDYTVTNYIPIIEITKKSQESTSQDTSNNSQDRKYYGFMLLNEDRINANLDFFRNVVFSDLNLQEASEMRYGYIGGSIEDDDENKKLKLKFDTGELGKEELIHALYFCQALLKNRPEEITNNRKNSEVER